MYASILSISLLLSSAYAFDTHLYTSKQCTGSANAVTANVAQGCSTERAGSFSGMINKWSSDADNKLVLATYSDAKCCHSSMIETFDWTDGCVEVQSGVQSWRVLDPSSPETGKAGETYSC